MAYDLLTTSGINSLVNYYINNEKLKRLSPLVSRKSKYTNISGIYSNLLTKVDALKGKLSILKTSDTSSVFALKKAVSSNTAAVTVSASNSAQKGSFSLHVNQLANNDLLMSLDNNSDDFSSINAPGTFTFNIKAGDGNGGEFTSNVSLQLVQDDFTGGHISFETLAQKLTKAINDDKATVISNSVSGSTLSSGSFTVDVNGQATTIDYSAGTYEEVIDSIISQLEGVSGLAAEKTVNGSEIQLKLTVTDSSKYITINGDTGSLVTELGLAVNKEKGASGLVTATAFAPSDGLTQISLSAKNSGTGYKISDISDISGGLLAEFGLNLGTSRTAFVQNESGLDTAGYVHSDNLLNAKLVFNGINIERYSNSISDLVSGITLNLKSVMAPEDNDVTIDVSNDVASIKTKIEDFITAFNDLYSYIKTNSNSTDGQRGVLLGDASASSLSRILNTAAYTPVSGLGFGTINSLSEMGITFDVNTGLSITDGARLTEVLENNIEEVEETFNSTSGIAKTLFQNLEPYSGFSGYLTKRKNNLEENIKTINDSITRIQTKIEKDSDSLRYQYIQLQSQLSALLTNSGVFGTDIFS